MSDWYGSIPLHWQRARVKSIAERVTDGAHISPETEDGVYDFVSTRDVKGGRVNFEGSLKTSQETYRYMVKTGCRPNPGDVLFSKDGTVGETAVVTECREFVVASSLVIITPRPSVMAPKYLAHVFASRPAQEQAASFMRGAGLPRLSVGNLTRLELLVPPLEEQRAIAEYLDRETARIDTLIEEQQRLIEMLRERRAGVIEARLESVGNMTRLKYVSVVQTGVTLSGDGDPADPEWPYLRVANVQVGRVDLQEVKTVRVSVERAALSMLQPGDVLMTEGGDIDKLGRGALWRGEVPNMLHQNHIFAVRPSEALDSQFLVDWLDGPIARTYFRMTARQTTNLAGTNKWTLGNLPVPVPPLDDQRRAVEAMERQKVLIDELILETERFIEIARERRTTLITAAVTGQIDVREMV